MGDELNSRTNTDEIEQRVHEELLGVGRMQCSGVFRGRAVLMSLDEVSDGNGPLKTSQITPV